MARPDAVVQADILDTIRELGGATEPTITDHTGRGLVEAASAPIVATGTLASGVTRSG